MNEKMEKLVQRVDALEEELSTLKRQVAVIESQSTNDIVKTEVKQVSSATRPNQTVTQTAVQKQSKHTEQPVQTKQKPKKEVDYEKVLVIWLPCIFMFILILGVLWGLKVGMDNGWITYQFRIILGYASTFLLYYLGMRYVKSEKQLFGFTLLGGLIALGILTTFAAHYLYGFFHYMLAFTIGIFYIALGLFLSIKTESETLTIFSAIAGFLLPFLLEGEGVTALQFCLYILLLFLSLFHISLRGRHKITFYITFLLFHLTLMIYSFFEGIYGNEFIVVATVLIQHLLLLYFYIKGSISKQVFTETLIYTNFVFTIGWIKLLEKPHEVAVYGLFALLYVLLTTYVFKKKDFSLQGVLSAVAVFAMSVFILSFNLENDQVKLALLLINGAIGLWVGLRYATKRTIISSSVIYGITAWTVISIMKIEQIVSYEHFVWLIFLLTMGWIYYSIYQFAPQRFNLQIKKIDVSLIIGQIVILLYIFHLTESWMIHANLSFETSSHLQVFIMWITLFLMYFAYKWKHGVYVTYAAVMEYLLLGFIIVSLPLNNDSINQWFLFHLFVQILYVSLLTALLVIIIKGKLPNQESLQRKASLFSIVLQVAFFLFLNKWYFAITEVYNWDKEYVFLFHTILLFLFAFVSISLGRKYNLKVVKIIGIIFVCICILKLFFIDLINISIIIRALLFIIVGIAGLLYSRTLLKQ